MLAPQTPCTHPLAVDDLEDATPPPGTELGSLVSIHLAGFSFSVVSSKMTRELLFVGLNRVVVEIDNSVDRSDYDISVHSIQVS